MGDYVLNIAPADPRHVPPPERLKQAFRYLQGLHDDVKEPWVGTGVSAMAGEGGLPLICPNCKTEHPEEKTDWVGEALSEIYDRTAKNFPHLDVTAPCCGASINLGDASLVDLRFPTPGYQTWGFSTACIAMWNFHDPFTPEQRAELERLLDCPIRLVFCKF